jgi:hypothetical protein
LQTEQLTSQHHATLEERPGADQLLEHKISSKDLSPLLEREREQLTLREQVLLQKEQILKQEHQNKFI